MTVPEEYGGQGFDLVCHCRSCSRRSRSAWMGIAGIIGSHSLACWMIARPRDRGAEAPVTCPSSPRASGVPGIALTEPAAGSDLQGIATHAVRDGDDYIVTGTKTWITNARYANPLPVLVKTDPDCDAAHIAGCPSAVDCGRLRRASPSRATSGKLGYKGPESCEVSLQDVRVPAANLLGGVEGRGLQQALSALEIGRINIASRAVGVAAGGARPGARLRPDAPRLRAADRGLPGDPAEARRHGDRDQRRPAAHLVGGIGRGQRA